MLPISVAALALEFATCCVNVLKLVKKTVESMKKAREGLLEVIRRVERMRTTLELLRSLAFQLQDSGEQDWFTNLSEEHCRQTMRQLTSVADEIAGTRLSSKLLGSMKWVFDEKKVASLLKSLSEQEAEIAHTVSLVSAKMTAETLRDVRNLQNRELASLGRAFDEVTLVDSARQSLDLPRTKSEVVEETDQNTQRIPVGTWLMHTITEGYSADYIGARTDLSDAAYFGKWEDFWDILEHGKAFYGESWVNTIRIKPLQNAHRVSFWTPLHQAVYNFAPVEVIQQMINEGALRTLRSKYTEPEEFPFPDMTPLELAQDLGYAHLYDILCPVLRYQMPLATLQRLEHQFHDLIRANLGNRVQTERLYLPVLEVLTELKTPQLWCPIRCHAHPKAGYLYRLDGRELVIRSYHMEGESVIKNYRITETQMFEIGDDPVLLDVYAT